MANGRVVVTQANDATPAVGGIFEGVSFFVVQRLPQRSSFLQRIQSNGGRVVKLEAQADHVIADQYRPDAPIGSISYTFIEAALKSGTLPNPQDHLAGPKPGTIRPAGSAIPGKGTRTPFTIEDDRQLWQWVERHKQQGGHDKGNEIYKQLEAINNRHTFQSWRDRYVKKLMHHPPAGVESMVSANAVVSANAPPSPPTAQDEQAVIEGSQEARQQEDMQEHALVEDENLPQDDIEMLLPNGDDIEDIPEEAQTDAWEAFAAAFARHSAVVWQQIWNEQARPVYLKQKAKKDGTELLGMDGTDELTSADHAGEGPDSDSRPSSAHKRKRGTPTASTSKVYGRKRQKAQGAEIFTEAEDAEHVTTPTKATSLPRVQASTAGTKEHQTANVAVVPPSHADATIHSDVDKAQANDTDDTIPTSELNREAQAQFDEEVFGIRRTMPEVIPAHDPALSTSEINRAADEQIRRESVGHDVEVDGTIQDVHPSSRARRPDEDNVGEDDAPHRVPSLQGGNALTEANLASQQAEHQARISRGTDLPPDDDAQDGDRQDQYATYLQDLIGQTGHVRPSGGTGTQLQPDEADDEEDLPSNPLATALDELDGDIAANLPLSSQQEIDETLDDMINWPASPRQSQKREVSRITLQGSQFETQAVYPTLPASGQARDIGMERTTGLEEPIYPQLPHTRQPGVALDHDDGTSDSSDSSNQSHSEGAGSSYVLVDQNDIPGDAADADQEDDIDMSVPMPEGGFDLSSSPARIRSSQPPSAQQAGNRWTTAINKREPLSSDDASEDEDVDGVNKPSRVIELSSGTSSSSSSSSSGDEPEPVTPRHRALETQDIVNAETQFPDFTMPLPPDSDNPSEALPSDSLDPPSSPTINNAATLQSQQALSQTQKLADSEVNTYIETMIVRHNLLEKSIINALKCTSLRPELAELVLLEEKVGRGLPSDVAGIWSEAEDQILEGGNAKGIRRLEDKHTWTECEERLSFLMEWRGEDEDE